jgi:hypothetical protein
MVQVSIRDPTFASCPRERDAHSLSPKPYPSLRYTFFYILYPLGAGSEAMLIFSTLPKYFPWQGVWTPREYLYGFLFVTWWPGELARRAGLLDSQVRLNRSGFI